MARAPAPPAMAALAIPPAGGAAGGMAAGGDPSAGAGADTGDDDSGSGDVIVTIVKAGDGSYIVYAGDEPSGSDDSSDDDADAMGPAGDVAAGGAAGGMAGGGAGGGGSSSQGTPADSIGEALKAALGILQDDASSAGAPGNADSQFAEGFSASKNPTPATGSSPQKY